jgi:NAD(P)-dependent dehydrogenase (short-subunit alcohol dehydrogenase family)
MSGRRVAITAAASGIGLAIARAFVAAGDRVHVCDADPDAVAQAAGEGLGATVVDVTDLAALDAWLDGVLAADDGLDVLVNNAGASGPTAPIEDITVDEWQRCLAIGLTSHYRAAARVLPAMKRAGSGSIIEISSTAGLYGLGRRTPYASAKWAVIGLAKSLAVELGPHGIRVNAICPGSVEGPRIRGVIEREAAVRGVPAEDVTRETLAGQSIARFVEPEEIAAMCLFLASEEARMVTGQAIAVDGHTEAFHL